MKKTEKKLLEGLNNFYGYDKTTQFNIIISCRNYFNNLINKPVETTNEQPKKCKYCPKNNIELCCKYRED